MRTLRLLGATITVATLLTLTITVHAATAFADPAFQAQWQRGEALSPNFWGPLATAKDGQREPYQQSPGGQRTVQYFDKGRMELSPTGAVTNGLLATELVTGKLQLGDTTFQPLPPPAIPVAGDPDNAGPTYAQLARPEDKGLFDPAPQQAGNAAQAAVSATGAISVSTVSKSAPATFTIYDGPTKHNVPRAFADYRARAGLGTIGYALCEPFWTTVKVGGTLRQVLAQVFERRVLTYTAANADPFTVEMGNVGRHYYQWRYGSGSGSAPAAQVPSSSAITTATPTENWSGYTVEAQNVTAVHAAWVVPAAVAPPTTGYSATWVGIGGVSEETLIQAGTEQDIENGATTYYAWVEGLPDDTLAISPKRLAANPGDVFSVTITNTSGDNWTLLLENRTSGKQITLSATYTSCKCSAEWIEELPEVDGNDAAPFANFGTVSFTEATATVNGVTQSFSALKAKPVALRQNRKTVAQPQAPGGDGTSFTITYQP